jgi:hypothetical protein
LPIAEQGGDRRAGRLHLHRRVAGADFGREADIRASRIVNFAPGSLPAKPAAVFKGVDMMNLFIVVETGDHHVTVLDGDKLEPIHRFPSRYALHGGPKFTPDGRYVFFASRDGWITKFDIWNLKVVAEIRAGINTRNVAVSGDGKYLAVANYLPHTLVLLDADLNLLKMHRGVDKERKESSRVSAVYDAAPRQSFVAALKDVPEVWEISYNPKADDIPVGMIHDFKYKEGSFIPGFLNPRRTFLTEPLDDFFFTQDYSELMGSSREGRQGPGGAPRREQEDRRPQAARHAAPGLRHHLEWYTPPRRTERTVMATPNLKEGLITVIDMKDWSTVKTIPTLGPGFFMRSHENTPYAWTDSMMSKGKDTLQVIDKRTLEKGRRGQDRSGQDPGPRRVHPRRQVRAGQPVGAQGRRRRADRVRCGDLQGGEAHPDGQAGGQVQPVQQDQPLGRHHERAATRRTSIAGASGRAAAPRFPLRRCAGRCCRRLCRQDASSGLPADCPYCLIALMSPGARSPRV